MGRGRNPLTTHHPAAPGTTLGAAPAREETALTDVIRAPWTPEQVAALNAWQTSSGTHPFTCGCDTCHPGINSVLHATPDGWRCPITGCQYVQDWAHPFMVQPDTTVRLRAMTPWMLEGRHGPTPDEVRAAQAEPTDEQRLHIGRQIAWRIRAELVCCHVYEQVQQGEREHPETRGSAHTICYWAEAAARIAENPDQWRNDPTEEVRGG
jgi:hypothetical protein